MASIIAQTEFGEFLLTENPDYISAICSRPSAAASADLTSAVAEYDGELPYRRVWWLARVIIRDPAYRGKGIGTYMVTRVTDAVLRSPAPCVIVAPGGYGSDIRRVQNFYLKLGFKMIGKGSVMVLQA